MSTQRGKFLVAFLLLPVTLLAPSGTRAADSYADLYQRAYDAFSKKDFTESERLASRAAEVAKEAVVPDRSEQLKALNLAGLSAGRSRHFDRAITHHAAAVAIADRSREPLDWARANQAYAIALTDGGQPAKAEGLLRQVVALRTEKLGPEHIDTLTSRGHLANALHQQRMYPEAMSENEAVFKILLRTLGPEHFHTLGIRVNMAGLLAAQGKYTEAEAENRDLLKIRERVLGPEHPDTLRSRYALAYSLQAQGKDSEAAKLGIPLKVHARVLGSENPELPDLREPLAVLLLNKWKYEDAGTEYQAALELLQRTLGPEHADTLRMRGELASTFAAQGDYKAAELQYREVLLVQKKKLPPEHPDLLDTLYNIALCQSKQAGVPDQVGLRTSKDDRYQEAREYASRAYEGALKSYGITNSITRKYLKLYDWLLQKKEEDKTADQLDSILKSLRR